MTTLHLALLSVFALAAIAPAVLRVAGRFTGWALALLPAALFGYFLTLTPAVAAGEAIRVTLLWAPTLDVELSLLVDGLGLAFALLITGIGAVVVAYAGGYLAGHRDLGRFYVALLAFMGAMLGLVLADDIIALFVFWELTSITSYLLIGFEHERREARAAALQALLVTGLGGLAMLAGLLMMGAVAGSWQLSEIVGAGDALRAHELYMPVLLLILAGAFTKSAQFPFHFWLPNAMQAPTPVSAYLHSATMVKAGVYLLARTFPALGGTELWFIIVGGAGAITMVLGALLALRQTDLKLLLAYSTVMALGTLVLLLGLGGPAAVKAAVVFLVVHSLYKGALFLVAGSLDHEAGTRDITRLGGLARAMPLTATVALLAGLSMAGLPPLLGFIGKELILEATLHLDRGAMLFTGAVILANAMLIAVTGGVALRPFHGERRATPKQPHEAPPSMWIGPLLLGAAGLVFGLLPNILVPPLFGPTAAGIRGEPVEVVLHLWPGFTPEFWISVGTLALGVAMYLAWTRLRGAMSRFDRAFAWGPSRWYDRSLHGLTRVAAWQTSLLQDGHLRHYTRVIFLSLAVLVAAAFLFRGGFGATFHGRDVFAYEVVLALLMVVAAMNVVRSTSRLASIVSLGVVGYSVALLFVEFGAPDLAMTQFLIETLIVIIVALVLIHLPHFPARPVHRAHREIMDVTIAGSVGVAITALVLSVLEHPLPRHVSEFFASRAVPEGHGHNIVNVILVDFRALDTLGEIVVLAVAGLGVFALLKLKPSDLPESAAPGQADEDRGGGKR